MVSVADIPLHIGERFIDRKRLEGIERRLKLVPPGFHHKVGEQVFLKREEIPADLLLTVHRLGCAEFYTQAQTDVEALVEHVKAADEENDRLREILRKYEAKEGHPENT